MHVITPTDADVITTAAAEMTGLAAPSRGSTELSTWKVSMKPDTAGPEHVMDREQVWAVTAGALEVVADGHTERVHAGQTVVFPADVIRSVRTTDQATEALVAMAVGGRALVDGESRPVPWAQ